MIIGPEIYGAWGIYTLSDVFNRLEQGAFVNDIYACNCVVGTFSLITALLGWYWRNTTVGYLSLVTFEWPRTMPDRCCGCALVVMFERGSDSKNRVKQSSLSTDTFHRVLTFSG